MIYLLAINGVMDNRFGILANPKMGVPKGVRNGMYWAADMGAISGPPFVKKFNPDIAIPWLRSMEQFRSHCLWVLAPDIVGSATDTLEAFSCIEGWPTAFAAQDGQEHLPFPDNFSCLFVGGSTGWKVGPSALSAIGRAQRLGKQIHIGRVNYWRRYEYFRGLPGGENFTCDGTRQRFQGSKRAMDAWLQYMDRPYTINMEGLC